MTTEWVVITRWRVGPPTRRSPGRLLWTLCGERLALGAGGESLRYP